jgi:hypothetical protein
LKNIGLCFFFLVLAACSKPGVTVRDANNSMGEIKSIISGLTGEPKEISDDRRQFTSQYFGRAKDKKFDAQKSHERFYARYTIVSDRRPYNVLVQVVKERKSSEGYREDGLDAEMTRKLAKELDHRLKNGNTSKSLIDDFRSF